MLETVVIEEAATRPPFMPIMRLPIKLASIILCVHAILFVLFTTTIADAVIVGSFVMITLSIRPLVALDYNGFDIFLVWLRLDLCALDTRDWGGTRVTPYPLRVKEFWGMS